MPLRFAINGLGRIGRALVRIALDRPGLELVGVNDQASAAQLARLLAHDSVHGRFPGSVAAADGALEIDGHLVPVLSAPTPAEIPWQRVSPTVVVESTGRFRARALAAGHLGDGANGVERVVVSATAADVDATFIVGVNEGSFDPARHRVISNASCTANCLAAVAVPLHRAFGLAQGFMHTVHCYTNSQNLVDMAHPDPRRARAAAINLIPTTSDAVEGLEAVLPELAGRVSGLAVRVPVPDGSLLELVAHLERPATARDVAAAYREAAAGAWAGILAVTDEELVSTDFIDSPHSATIDLPLLAAMGDRLVRVFAWYDNEWGYASRLADLLEHIAATTAVGARERAAPDRGDRARRRERP